MEGLREAAVAVQSSEFARVHERVLDQPGNTPVEVLKQLKQAAKVILCHAYKSMQALYQRHVTLQALCKWQGKMSIICMLLHLRLRRWGTLGLFSRV